MRSAVLSQHLLTPHMKQRPSRSLSFAYPYMETSEDMEGQFEWLQEFHESLEYDEQGRPRYKEGAIERLWGDN